MSWVSPGRPEGHEHCACHPGAGLPSHHWGGIRRATPTAIRWFARTSVSVSTPLTDLSDVLRSLHPVKNDGVYVFASVPLDFDLSPLMPVATIREHEGLTVIVEEWRATAADLTVLFRATWITLNVHSDLHAVGLTAAFAAALAQAHIGCNVIAGAFHDHIFVAVESGEIALARLRELQAQACLARNCRNARLPGSSFVAVDLGSAAFDDVNLRNAVFANVALEGASFHDVNLACASIADANLEGMKINGVLVSDLFSAYNQVNLT
jgi:hypothetical protein